MASRISTQTTYEAAQSIEPIFTGGSISANAGGDLIATSVDEDVLLVRTSTGKPLCRIEGDGETLTSLALSPNAAHLVVCSRSLSMRIFAVKLNEDNSGTAELLRTLKPHTTPVVSSTIDDTGALLATGGADGSVKVWDLRGGYASHTFHPHGGVVSALAFSHAEIANEASQKPDADSRTILLASGAEDGTIKIHNLNTRKPVATLDSHVSVVRSLKFSANNKTLLSCSRDRTIILWNTRSWRSEKVLPALEVLESAGWFDSERYIFAGGENGDLRIWDGMSGRELTTRKTQVFETDAIVDIVCLSEESNLVTIHQDQSFQFHSFNGIATLSKDHSPVELPMQRRITGNHDEVIDMVYVGPDQSLLGLATNTESVKLISVASSETRKRHPISEPTDVAFGSDVALLEGHSDIIICLSVDWSGHWLATGAKDNTARLWQLDPASSSYHCAAVFEGHAESIGAIALPQSPATGSLSAKDPLGHPPVFLLTGSQDKTVKKWDTSKLDLRNRETQNGFRAMYTRVAHEKDINAIDASATTPLFASASQDKTIKIWSLEDGSVTGILRGHKRGVWSVKFSPAGTPPISLAEGGSSSARGLLVSGSGDRTVKVWSLSTYTCLLTFEGHSNSVLKVIWIPPPVSPAEDALNGSGRQTQQKQPLIASASSDTLVKLWTPYAAADSDHLLATLDNHSDRVWALASPRAVDASSHIACQYPLISGAADATITFWRDTTKQTASQAIRRATERIEQDQLLQNHIHAKNYREVITLSLALNHPGRLLRVFQDVVTLPETERDEDSIMGVNAVDDVLGSLDQQQVMSLLERVRDWNTNARTANVAQRVLNCLLKSYPVSFFTAMASDRKFNTAGKGVKDLMRALEVYTDRHYKRMEELVDESYLLEYTLREMNEVIGAVGGMGGSLTNGHGSRMNGDMMMA